MLVAALGRVVVALAGDVLFAAAGGCEAGGVEDCCWVGADADGEDSDCEDGDCVVGELGVGCVDEVEGWGCAVDVVVVISSPGAADAPYETPAPNEA